MDDESPSPKLKLYLFSSADADYQYDQQHLPVKEKKGGILTGPRTLTSVQMIDSKSSAPEMRQLTSELEEQGTPETCQAGVLQGSDINLMLPQSKRTLSQLT